QDSRQRIHSFVNRARTSYSLPSDARVVTSQFSMKDLTDPRWIKLKGILFLVIAALSSTLLILEKPTLKVGLLLAISIWCACRFYYFAFYVIEHYVDSSYRFSGLWSFAVYLLTKRGKDQG